LPLRVGVFELQADASEQECSYNDPFTEEHRRLLKITQEEIFGGEIGE
jgi:hypothetical protein